MYKKAFFCVMFWCAPLSAMAKSGEASPAAPADQTRRPVQHVGLPADIASGPRDEDEATLREWCARQEPSAALNRFFLQKQEREQEAIEAIEALIATAKTALPTRKERLLLMAMDARVQRAMDVVRLLRLQGTVPALKALMNAGLQDAAYCRRAARALHAIGVEDGYWIECLKKRSADGHDDVACAAFREVWDSPSEKIRETIAAMRKDLADRRAGGEKVDIGTGMPFLLVQVAPELDRIEAAYAKASVKERLRLVDEASRRGKISALLTGGETRWYREYGWSHLYGSDYAYHYIHVRWAAKRLGELSREQPQAVADYIVSLPNRKEQGLELKDEELPAFREYLMQWVTPAVRGEVAKRLGASNPSWGSQRKCAL